jgi:hypothetical protein
MKVVTALIMGAAIGPRDSDVKRRIVFGLSLPVFRTLALTVGFLAQVALGLVVFRLVDLVSRARRGVKRCGPEQGPTSQ